MSKQIESGPGMIFLSQIQAQSVGLDTLNKKELSKVIQSLKKLKYNLVLPIVCLSDEEDKFLLLTGLPIYEAAVKSGLEQIWVFLIANNKFDAEKLLEQFSLQAKLNDRVIRSDDFIDFMVFLNNAKSPLTELRGIGEKYAAKIISRRPYKSADDVQKQLGFKQSLKWLAAYKEWKAQD